MKNFVKMKTRLNCDLFEAYRSLTRKEKMEKWGAIYEANQFQIKSERVLLNAQISEVGDLNDIVKPVVWECVLKVLKENALDYKDLVQKCQFTFYRMNCIRKAEYCAEVHLVIEPIGTVEIEASILTEIGEFVLDQIRKRYNKDWVILDSDLNASILKGSL